MSPLRRQGPAITADRGHARLVTAVAELCAERGYANFGAEDLLGETLPRK